MRSYYRDNNTSDLSAPHDSNRPVSQEKLRALKLGYWSLNGTDAQRQAGLKELSKNLGFVPGQTKEINYDFKKSGVPDMANLSFAQQMAIVSKDFMNPAELVIVLLSGAGFLDILESGTGAYIRLALTAGDALHIPAGMVMQGYPDKVAMDNVTLCSLGDVVPPPGSTLPMPFGDDIAKSPVRAAYLKSIGAA
ncbi:hypothetical protein L218DRAFT_998439 [Marasmius fiardii PR-910]|nr:hypothetical protein L218DRAFT_998439 [Marasmius fiardii PR-910]